ncbi:hypothetical protein [Microbulbifer epialgicus]|uniref:DUF4468 domain-containing protein n=1 Tax=Microbulbifer epialgicus TaxID=393907 RepID=A0ABV4P7P3_9GAMM
MGTRIRSLTLLISIFFSGGTIANEVLNNVLVDSHYDSLKSISERSIASSNVSLSDINQLANRSRFLVEQSSESIRADLSVDGTSVSIIAEKSKSGPDFLSITIKAANANYNIELDIKNSEYVISGYGSKLGTEGKILLYAMLTKMTENKWQKSENLYKSKSYRIVNWFSEMPAGMVTHIIDSRNKSEKGEPDPDPYNRSSIIPKT